MCISIIRLHRGRKQVWQRTSLNLLRKLEKVSNVILNLQNWIESLLIEVAHDIFTNPCQSGSESFSLNNEGEILCFAFCREHVLTTTKDVFIIQPAAWFRLTLPSHYPPGRSVREGHQHGEVQRYHLIVLKYVGLQITKQEVICTIQVISVMSK